MFKIKVTADHIARGRLCNARFCPITLAVRDAVPLDERDDVTTGLDEGGVTSRGRFRLPVPAVEFRRRFDARLPVEPFEFEIEFRPHSESAT